MSGFNCLEFTKNTGKSSNREEKEASSLKPKGKNKIMETYAHIRDVLSRVKNKVNHSKTTADLSRCEIYDQGDNIRHFLWELMKTNKKDKTKANFLADIYFTRMQEKMNKLMEQNIQPIKFRPPLPNQVKDIQKAETKKCDDKMNYAKKYFELIKACSEDIPFKTFELLDEKRILVTFKNPPDCKQFRLRLEKIFPGITIFEEQNKKAQVVIDNVGNISQEDLEHEIEKITNEKPKVIEIVEMKEERKWRAQVELTTLAMLKLQAQNESTVTIGDLESLYQQLSE